MNKLRAILKYKPFIAGLVVILTVGGGIALAHYVNAKKTSQVALSPTPEPTLTPTEEPTSTPTPILTPPTATLTPTPPKAVSQTLSRFTMIKNFGEPMFDNFGLTEADFKNIKEAGFNLIGVEFDICAGDKDVKYLLDMAQKYNLKVVLPAGAGEAEWGYECDKQIPLTQGPVWQKDKVQQWVKKWKDHSALHSWDTDNEDGLNFPNGENNPAIGQGWTKFSLSIDQIKTAYNDVKAIDNKHPIMIRMSGFAFSDYKDNFFRAGNYFAKDISDIVMVNLYTNYLDSYDPNFVGETADKAQKSIRSVDNDVTIIIALASWKEPNDGQVKLPLRSELERDFRQVLARKGTLSGVAYFKYGAKEGNDWFLPDAARGNVDLWHDVKKYNQEYMH